MESRKLELLVSGLVVKSVRKLGLGSIVLILKKYIQSVPPLKDIVRELGQHGVGPI